MLVHSSFHGEYFAGVADSSKKENRFRRYRFPPKFFHVPMLTVAIPVLEFN